MNSIRTAILILLAASAAHADIPTVTPRLIEIAGPLADPDAEISSMVWYGDSLVLLPQHPERFARLKEGLEKHCPGMILQFSTGGRSGAGQARGGMLPLRPDMASLTVKRPECPRPMCELVSCRWRQWLILV